MGITQTINVLKRQALYIIAAAALVLAIVLPSLVSAATVTERSIALSSSSKKATGVTYDVKFTASSTGAAGAFVVQFCDTTPLIGEDCGAGPTGFDASSATTSTSGATISTKSANQVVVDKTIANSDAVEVALDGITNPDDAGTIYARIITYDNDTDAQAYAATNLGSGVKDQGSVAISITDSVGVSGAVLETMTFCVSGGEDGHPETNPITDSCGGTLTAPSLKLGKDTNDVIALDSDAVYSGVIYTQISTNAVGGAAVNLKSNTICGGLHRSGADDSLCDIAAAGVASGDDVTAGSALFGLKLGPDVDDSASGNGKFVAASTNYNSTKYHLNYVSGGASGVTSTYGDPILNTADGPANNLDMPLTFGASVANNTPAGNYSADLSLVATGKF